MSEYIKPSIITNLTPRMLKYYSENMKRLFILFCLFTINVPVFADVINPKLTPAQWEKLRQERQERFLYRQRMSYINNICGELSSDKKACKAKLKAEYDANLKILDKYVKESSKNAEENLKNASKR